MIDWLNLSENKPLRAFLVEEVRESCLSVVHIYVFV